MTLDKIQTILLTLTFVVPGFIIQSVFSLFTPRRKEEKEILLLRFLAFSSLNIFCCLWIVLPFVNTNLETKSEYIKDHPLLTTFCFLFVNFVSPLFLGVVVGVLDRREVLGRTFQTLALWQPLKPTRYTIRKRFFVWLSYRFRRWLSHFRLGNIRARLKRATRSRPFKPLAMSLMHPIPTAWDYQFGVVCDRIQAGEINGCFVKVLQGDGKYLLGYFGGNGFVSSDAAERDLYLSYVYDLNDVNEWVIRKRTNGVILKGNNIQSIEFLLEEDAPEDKEILETIFQEEIKQNG